MHMLWLHLWCTCKWVVNEFYQQEADAANWAVGRNEQEARTRAAKQFGVPADQIELKQVHIRSISFHRNQRSATIVTFSNYRKQG